MEFLHDPIPRKGSDSTNQPTKYTVQTAEKDNCSRKPANGNGNQSYIFFTVKLKLFEAAVQSFEKSLDTAKELNDEDAQTAITKALDDVREK